MLIGYARTSTKDQKYSLESQIEQLEKAGCEKFYKEQVSSVDASRPQLEAALDYIREGDILIVTKLDRLARSVADTVAIQKRLEGKQAGLKILDIEIDTTTPTGKLQFNLFAAIAQFEREVMLERQRIGIEKAKAEGKYQGRKPLPEEKKNKIKELVSTTNMTKEDIAKTVGVGVASVYRVIKE
ncbi:recombinase family protein [Acinetobacter radioresistens]|uniref:recombinase family protein n=2 Tax=Acinetobacter radioresistens TaxID=40216 RepID=UPI0006197796|nr:recombinase family protein [Acinetobacter radioresistens]